MFNNTAVLVHVELLVPATLIHNPTIQSTFIGIALYHRAAGQKFRCRFGSPMSKTEAPLVGTNSPRRHRDETLNLKGESIVFCWTLESRIMNERMFSMTYCDEDVQESRYDHPQSILMFKFSSQSDSVVENYNITQ